MSILCAAVTSDQFPSEMIKGSPQVVDSVAYYQGEGLDAITGLESDLDIIAAGLRIFVDPKFVGVVPNENAKSRFKVSDVMIGPFDL